MSSRDLERVRDDLSTIRNVLGLELPWGRADVWFCGASAVAGGLYAALSWPDSPLEVTSLWAAVPLFGVIAAYLFYISVKSHRLPPREESRRREYRSTLIAIAIAVPAVAGLLLWRKYAGMTGMQLGGGLLAFMGVAFLVVGIAQPPARYPRSYFIIGAVPLIVFGLLIPFVTPRYCHSLIGLLGLVELGLATIIMHWHMRRHLADRGDHVGN